MTKIKGPLKFENGFDSASFVKEKMAGVKIKLPFTATGFKSSKKPEGVDYSGIEFKKETKSKSKEVKEVKEVKEEPIEEEAEEPIEESVEETEEEVEEIVESVEEEIKEGD